MAAKGGPVSLTDDTLSSGETPGSRSSARVSGQIIYQSPNVFTVTTPTTLADGSKALHRDAAPAASLTKISDVNVKTVMGAQRLLSAVDGALRRVDAERGDLGATMNRMEHTIDNLSNIAVNTKISRSRMQDADMAAELLDQHSIPYYLKMDWFSSAFNVEATSLSGQMVRIFVPEEHMNKASELTLAILGQAK